MRDSLIPAFKKDMNKLIEDTNNENCRGLLRIIIRRNEYSWDKETRYIFHIDRELGNNQHWRDIKAAYF